MYYHLIGGIIALGSVFSNFFGEKRLRVTWGNNPRSETRSIAVADNLRAENHFLFRDKEC